MLAADGLDDFTMAAMAAMAERSGSGLAGVVGAYPHGLADMLDANRAFFPDLMIPRSAKMSGRGLQAISEVERLFRDAAEQHRAEVKRRDVGAAIDLAGRVITSTCPQACARRDMPDQAAWARLAGELADELAARAMAYLQPGQ